MRKIGKLFSLLLCAVMAVGLFPPAALAAQESETAVTLVEDTGMEPVIQVGIMTTEQNLH